MIGLFYLQDTGWLCLRHRCNMATVCGRGLSTNTEGRINTEENNNEGNIIDELSHIPWCRYRETGYSDGCKRHCFSEINAKTQPITCRGHKHEANMAITVTLDLVIWPQELQSCQHILLHGGIGNPQGSLMVYVDCELRYMCNGDIGQ